MRHAGLLRAAAATVNVSYLTLVTDNSMINIVAEQILLTSDGVKYFTHFRHLNHKHRTRVEDGAIVEGMHIVVGQVQSDPTWPPLVVGLQWRPPRPGPAAPGRCGPVSAGPLP